MTFLVRNLVCLFVCLDKGLKFRKDDLVISITITAAYAAVRMAKRTKAVKCQSTQHMPLPPSLTLNPAMHSVKCNCKVGLRRVSAFNDYIDSPSILNIVQNVMVRITKAQFHSWSS
jgi:hypothetical protein